MMVALDVKAKRKRRNKVMAIQKAIVARKQRARIGQTVELFVDGPSKEHDLVLQARLRGHAPDIDPVVYLTDCDLADFAPGRSSGRRSSTPATTTSSPGPCPT